MMLTAQDIGLESRVPDVSGPGCGLLKKDFADITKISYGVSQIPTCVYGISLETVINRSFRVS